MWLMKSATATASGTAIIDRDRRRQHGAEGERGDVVDQALAAGQFRGRGVDRRQRLDQEEDRDPGEQGEDRDRRGDGEVGEDPVAAAAPAAGGRGEDLTRVGRGVDSGLQGSAPIKAHGAPPHGDGAPLSALVPRIA